MSILDTITSNRRQQMAELTLDPHFSVSRLNTHIEKYARPTRSLYKALAQADKGFILECKKASPSKGLIRADFDPVTIARIYQRYAAAISVLTEPSYFAGSFDYLQAVSDQVKVPVLCKDFIISPLQVYLARYYGADAILLMLSALSDSEYRSLAGLAQSLDLEILTEVSTYEEMQRAAALRAKIIGINHRNLHDLTIDTERSEKLASYAPDGALLVAESGFSSNQQVRQTAPFVDGFLVGSFLTAQPDIEQACKNLIYGENKVCGLTSPAAALSVASAGARFGGLIFAPDSPRCVTTQEALSICSQVPQLDYVAVTVSDNMADIETLAHDLPLYAIQLHGQQSKEFVQALRLRLPTQVKIWYAIDMSTSKDAALAIAQWLEASVDRVVLDHGKGGSGQAFDWTLLEQLSAEQKQLCLLAGGLNLNNINAATRIGCAGLDINSGVETSPGEKDPALIHQAFKQIASYFRQTNSTTLPAPRKENLI